MRLMESSTCASMVLEDMSAFSMRHEDRNGHRCQDFSGDSTQQHLPKVGVAITTHDQEIGR